MDKVIENIKSIALKYPAVSKILLFGSRARGDHHDKSDYDIAIVAPGLTLEQKNRFSDEIDEIDTFHKVDLVFLKGLNDKKSLCENIKKDGKVIVDKFNTKFENYKNALSSLHEAIDLYRINTNLVMRDGVIQRFEFTTELSWKMIQEYLISLQIPKINNPKAVMAEAYNK